MDTKSLFVKTVNYNLENKSIDELVKELIDIYVNGLTLHEDQSDYIDLLFLLYLDAISKRFYDKRTEGDVRPLISLAEYTNSSAAGGYFDRVFEAASRLINRIINHPNWNIILKIDAHNSPSGPSRYSLVSKNHYTDKLDRTSKAYYLFFLYKKYCDELVASENNELTSDTVYTVHRDLSSRKTIRSITYQFDGHNFLRYYDGNISTEEEVVTIDFGERCYLDFLACVLDKDFTKRSRGSAYGFASYYNDNETQTVWDTPKSFSFFNLGVSGFESWGTLMIEAFSFLDENKNDLGSAKSVNSFFFREDDGEDNSQLIKIKSIVSALKKIDDEFYDALNKERINKEAEKSAKAAIMSRNMSHNLGSHVMAYLKHHLSSVKDMLNDKILSQLFDNEDDLKSLIESPTDYSPKLLAKLSVRATEENETTAASTSNTANNAVASNNSEEDVINNVALPFLVGLGQFISYLQERQDFIATIATDYIPYYSSVNFKDFIYDELNNDKRYERHPDRQNLKPDNILLGNIARSEGLGRVTCPTNTIDDKTTLHDIVLKFRTVFNGDPVEEIKRPRVNPFDYYSEADLPKAKEELDEMRNYDVSLPGGIVGRQAIFSIIENIIRNAAKHGNWREKGKLEITIDIFSKEDVLDSNPTASLKNRLRDDDNSSIHSLSLKQVLLKYYCGDGDKGNDLYFITITDNLSMPLQGADEKEGIAPSSISSLRKALIEDYIDETSSQMKNSNKGIKEMRISSAWLRSMEDDKRYYLYDENKYYLEDGLWGDTSNDVPPVLYARISKDCEGDCHLQYIFCLVRPQKIAFVSSEFSSLSKETEQILRKSFWKAFTPESFFNHHNKSFDLVVYDGARKKDDPFYSQIRRISSSKFLCLQDDDVALKDVIQLKECIIKGEGLSKKKLEAAELLLYRHLSHWDGAEHILISDIKAESHFNQDAQKDVNVGDKISFKLDDPAAKYRYLTHLEDRVRFKEHIIKDYDYASRFKFSEGITGNNSTDRLVRNERLTEIWFYKHLHAMKKKVAIFDERIFSKSFGLEESDLSIPVFDDPRYASYKNASEEVRQAFLKFRNLSPRIDLDAIDTKNYIGATYVFKGVFVFSIIRSNEDNRAFNLYGCRINLDNDNTFSECIRFASISWNEKEKKLDISPCEGVDSDVLSGYDAISIHQGLLDKLYGLFGIKSDSQASENLTRDFYSQFVGDKNIIDFTEPGRDNVLHHFLPGMTIHSGRSKPSENDMPQRLPFIPFSAIEHAVLDCKYSLIELLDSARYE